MDRLTDKISNLPNLQCIIKNESLKKEIPVILFGKDDIGNIAYNILINNNITLKQQCDENDFILKTNNFDLFDVVVTNRNPEKSKQFLEKQDNIRKIFYYDVLGEKQYSLSYTDFVNNITQYERVYNLFEDEMSKKVFVAFINTKITSDYRYTEKVETWGQYVEHGIVDFSKINVIADCGAYCGEDVIKFSEVCNKIGSKHENIIAFEADSRNILKIKRMIEEKNMQNIELHNLAVWDQKKKLMFEQEKQESWSHISKNGKEVINADTIDNILNGRKCDYIKMDVEGAEYNALIGAKNTILKYKTQLAISVYHKQNDLIDIPLLLKEYNPSYKFYLRNYSKFGMECVLYAVTR